MVNLHTFKLKHPEAAYGREKEVYVVEQTCDMCGAEGVPQLLCDTSDGEYGAVILCAKCLRDTILPVLEQTQPNKP